MSKARHLKQRTKILKEQLGRRKQGSHAFEIATKALEKVLNKRKALKSVINSNCLSDSFLSAINQG